MRILDGSVRSLSDDVKYLGTLRGRLGWTPTSGWLIYGTGGLAWERADRTRSIVSTGGPAVLAFEGVIPRDQFGWVAGAGAETFIGSSNWLARLEYLHYDFGTVEQTSGVTSTAPGAFQSVDRGGHQRRFAPACPTSSRHNARGRPTWSDVLPAVTSKMAAIYLNLTPNNRQRPPDLRTGAKRRARGAPARLRPKLYAPRRAYLP
jgi:hypothetical protein